MASDSIPARFARTVAVALVAMAAMYLALGKDGSLPDATLPRIGALAILVPALAVWIGAGWNLVHLADAAAERVHGAFQQSLVRVCVYLVLAALFLAVIVPLGLLLEGQ